MPALGIANASEDIDSMQTEMHAKTSTNVDWVGADGAGATISWAVSVVTVCVRMASCPGAVDAWTSTNAKEIPAKPDNLAPTGLDLLHATATVAIRPSLTVRAATSTNAASMAGRARADVPTLMADTPADVQIIITKREMAIAFRRPRDSNNFSRNQDLIRVGAMEFQLVKLNPRPDFFRRAASIDPESVSTLAAKK